MAAERVATEMYNRVGAEALCERVNEVKAKEHPLLLQGPMGTMLMSEPFGEDVPAASWNVSEPQLVERIHGLYRAAGADVLITNTFQASAPALERDAVRQSVAVINRAAVDCARRVGEGLLVGSIGPCGVDWTLEDSPEFRRAREAYREQARQLLQAGVDGLLLETFTSIRQTTPALAGVRDASDGMPLWVSFAIDEKGNLLGDNLNIEAACMHAAKAGASAVGVNCCSLAAATASVPRMVRAVDLPVMVRPNAGSPHRDDEGRLAWNEDPGAFSTACREWIAAGAALVGTCCGATPLTTCALEDVLAAV